MKPVVGQEVYFVCQGTAHPTIVRKVGRKYFTCSTEKAPYYEQEYCNITWVNRNNFGNNSRLYATPQEYRDEITAQRICSEISCAFEHGRNTKKVSLPILLHIQALIQ